MKSYIFKIAIKETQSPTGKRLYYAYCPAMSSYQVSGKTPENALDNLSATIGDYVRNLIESGKPVTADKIEEATGKPGTRLEITLKVTVQPDGKVTSDFLLPIQK